MAETPNPPENVKSSEPPPPPPRPPPTKPTIAKNGSFSGHKTHFPNPPDSVNPDAATLREQWKFAIRQYSKWSSHAWGTAILAGGAFFALGWIIKGENPISSRDSNPHKGEASDSSRSD